MKEQESGLMISAWTLLLRGLFLRCPMCGKGKLFKNWLTMYENCPVCHFHYEREPGYFTGAMAINLVISELIVTAYVFPVAVLAGMYPATTPTIPLLLIGAPMTVLLPLLFYRHSRGFWMSTDHRLNPVVSDEFSYRK